jgi:hypothetical protein
MQYANCLDWAIATAKALKIRRKKTQLFQLRLWLSFHYAEK